MENMIIPPFLKAGDKVALVSPAGCIEPACLERGVRQLSAWGLQPVQGRHVSDRAALFAGRREDRLRDLQWALDDPEIKAVIATRGGYGTAALIDDLDFTAFNRRPKWVVGFSDLTVLLSHLQRHLHVASLHAAMPQTYPQAVEGAPALDTLRCALFGEALGYAALPPHPAQRAGAARAPLVGGNLSVLYSLRGTSTDLDPAGKILFFEDLNELDYHVDRMLLNLYRGGWFDRPAGVVVGAFTGIRARARPLEETVVQTVERYVAAAYAKGARYPVYYGFPAGHIENHHALYMGVPAELRVGAPGQTASLVFDSH
ncbi:MAG: LD-carboxypeptidase [Bacteroidales bacterium]|nr:LD-carboxypeptidase [Bacteroidales bacterium]